MPAGQPPRKPRVLAVVLPAPVRHEIAAPVRSRQKKQVKPKIPVSETGRIRAWAKYGMTAGQIAEVCGVAVGEIERILRQA